MWLRKTVFLLEVMDIGHIVLQRFADETEQLSDYA
jgi:hypothetical protein